MIAFDNAKLSPRRTLVATSCYGITLIVALIHAAYEWTLAKTASR
jgi:hypothetical protein